jgi:hypothetical protein
MLLCVYWDVMRPVRSFCFSIVVAASLAGPVLAQEADDSLRNYAIHVFQNENEKWTGYGIYLGKGYFLTAAHVAGLWFWRWPTLEVGGTKYPTSVAKDGHFHRLDLTVLSVDEKLLPVSLAMRRMPLCKRAPWAGEPVIVATPEGVTRSRVLSPRALPFPWRIKYPTIIQYIAESGASGSGVFDANKKCLLGIISGIIPSGQTKEENGVKQPIYFAKYFVPVSKIAEFLPADARF